MHRYWSPGTPHGLASLTLALAALALHAPLATAADGAAMAPPPGDKKTYYETILDGASLEAFASSEPQLPDRLAIVGSNATVEYSPLGSDGSRTEWEVSVRNFARPHERVGALYDVILALPLPAEGNGGLETLQQKIVVREGSEANSVSFVYAGEKLVLKRNIGLEKSLLPSLVSSAGEPDKLPALDGTGYRYTMWDTIVTHDPEHGSTIQGWASLRYETDAGVLEPSVIDEQIAAYLITWIPGLSSSIAPYTIRMEVRAPDVL